MYIIQNYVSLFLNIVIATKMLNYCCIQFIKKVNMQSEKTFKTIFVFIIIIIFFFFFPWGWPNYGLINIQILSDQYSGTQRTEFSVIFRRFMRVQLHWITETQAKSGYGMVWGPVGTALALVVCCNNPRRKVPIVKMFKHLHSVLIYLLR